jgi:hypothetical protein
MHLKVHLPTKVALLLGAAGFLCGNATESRLVGPLEVVPPPSLGFTAGYAFMHGWPISPWMASMYHGNQFHPEEDPRCWLALAFDGLVAFVSLYALASLIEWFMSNKPKLRRSTRLVVVLLAAMVLWMNVRTPLTGTQVSVQDAQDYGVPSGYSWVRGWPLPAYTCSHHGGRLRYFKTFGSQAFTFNAIVAFDALVAVAFLWERGIGIWQRKTWGRWESSAAGG